jgi:hypothetical protein
MSEVTPRPTAPVPASAARSRRVGGSIGFTILLAAGVAAAFLLIPDASAAEAAAAAWGVFLLLVIAAADLVALAGARRHRAPRYMRWLPEWPLGGWLDPVRSSFVMVAFFYGIIFGHFFWR